MRPIEGKFQSQHSQKEYSFGPVQEKWVEEGATVSKVRSSPGYPVKSFRNLVNEVAKVTLNNRNYEMFYRGQTKDYLDSQSAYYNGQTNKTILYPTICRPNKKPGGKYKASIRKNQIIKRYESLYKLIDFTSEPGRRDHDEYYFTLFQHYEIIPTPLIDITQSLRIAATFALRNSKSGFVYVFGLPYPNGSISHFIDHEIVLVKLQNVCPVGALRPRYQEGYLVGKYPFRDTKEAGDNLARRLVAKFMLDNTTDGFWDVNFTPIPNDILFPPDDPFGKSIENMNSSFKELI